VAERVLVLSASPWEFKAESGEQMRGVTVEFIMPEISHGPRVFGSQVIKETADHSLADVFRLADLPAIMDLEVGMARGKDMKSKMVIKSATTVEAVRPFNRPVARVEKAA
jgi:hypothetical protein